MVELFCDENRRYGSHQFIAYIECEEVEGVPVDLFRGMVELSKLKKSSMEDLLHQGFDTPGHA